MLNQTVLAPNLKPEGKKECIIIPEQKKLFCLHEEFLRLPVPISFQSDLARAIRGIEKLPPLPGEKLRKSIIIATMRDKEIVNGTADMPIEKIPFRKLLWRMYSLVKSGKHLLRNGYPNIIGYYDDDVLVVNKRESLWHCVSIPAENAWHTALIFY